MGGQKRWIFFAQHFYFMSKLSKNQCCTDRSWSDLVVVIDIPCYFRPKCRGSIFGQNNMVCLWQPLYLTRIGQYNIHFLKVGTTSNYVLQRKSIFFAGPLNFLNKPLFWLCLTDYIHHYSDVPSVTSIGNSAQWGTQNPDTGCLIVLT